MSIEIKIAKERDSKCWDSLVELSPHGTISHTWKWLKLIEKQTKSRLYPIIGSMGSTPKALIPLFVQRKKRINLVFSPPPESLLLYLGPLILHYDELKQSKKESIFSEFLEKVNAFIESELNPAFIRIRSSPGFFDSRQFSWTNYKVNPNYTYIIDLSKGLDDVWKNFNSQVRIDVNKTAEMGVKIKHGSKKELDFIRDSISNRFRDQKIKRPNSYKRYLNDIYRNFPDNFKIFTAQYKGKNVGGLTLLCFKERVSLWVGVPKNTIKGIYPNELAIWESIKWAYKNGYREYEIVDAGVNPRLRQFKSKFNPNIVLWFTAVKYSSRMFETLDWLRRMK